ncbi:MAG: hypothetical protein WC959_01590 [Kiritimatiellales bacterium]
MTCKPVMKLASKARSGSRYIKIYDVPTLYERLNASGTFTPEKTEALKREYNTLNPLDLKERIKTQLRHIEELKKQAGASAA